MASIMSVVSAAEYNVLKEKYDCLSASLIDMQSKYSDALEHARACEAVRDDLNAKLQKATVTISNLRDENKRLQDGAAAANVTVSKTDVNNVNIANKIIQNTFTDPKMFMDYLRQHPEELKSFVSTLPKDELKALMPAVMPAAAVNAPALPAPEQKLPVVGAGYTFDPAGKFEAAPSIQVVENVNQNMDMQGRVMNSSVSRTTTVNLKLTPEMREKLIPQLNGFLSESVLRAFPDDKLAMIAQKKGLM